MAIDGEMPGSAPPTIPQATPTNAAGMVQLVASAFQASASSVIAVQPRSRAQTPAGIATPSSFAKTSHSSDRAADRIEEDGRSQPLAVVERRRGNEERERDADSRGTARAAT